MRAVVVAILIGVFSTSVVLANRSSSATGIGILKHEMFASIPQFWPTKLRAGNAAPGSDSHESMTIETLVGTNNIFFQAPGLIAELFDNIDITDAMTAAAQEIADADADVDKDQTPQLHFDAESFLQSQARIRSLADAVAGLLMAGKISDARLALGSALHTVQDFYSHTNYVERGNTTPAPQLVWPFPQFNLLDLAGSEATCDQAEPEPDTAYLTSGYYGASGGSRYISKCIHGGPFDSLPGLGINKDTLSGLYSPHHLLHFDAARLARLSTAEYIRGIRDRLESLGLNPVDALETLGPLFNIARLQLENTNNTSPVEISINVARGSLNATSALLPHESEFWMLPDLRRCVICALRGQGTVYELEVTGEWSASFTGLAGYSLKLPPTLEFVDVRSDRGTTTQLSGREHVDLFVLYPVSGPPHRVNTYRIKPS
jgi:hypothetical protein